MNGQIRLVEGSSGRVVVHKDVDKRLVDRLMKDKRALVWVDFCEMELEKSEQVLRDWFGFHPLAVEDALEEQHAPKIDDWGPYVYLVLQDANMADPDRSIEVDVFLGSSYLVTHAKQTAPAIEHLIDKATSDTRTFQFGAARLLSRLANEIADNYLTVLDEINEEIEAMEEKLFRDPGPELLEQAFGLKRNLLHMRRFLGPQRDVLIKLSRGEYEVVQKTERVYFRDISDHFVRLEGINESLIELTVAARDTYLSVVNNRLNDVVKVLTIITSLFMPLTFLTGFFGMNFFGPTEVRFDTWTGEVAFGLTVLLIVGLPAAMYFWIKRKRWL